MFASKYWIVCIGLTAFTFGNAAHAQDVTLTGLISCSKCTLKETPKCGNAIQVTEGGKTTTYFIVDQGAKENYHAEVCGGAKKEGKVTGMVTEKDGKKWITPKKVEYTGATSDSRTTPNGARDFSEAMVTVKDVGNGETTATCPNCPAGAKTVAMSITATTASCANCSVAAAPSSVATPGRGIAQPVASVGRSCCCKR